MGIDGSTEIAIWNLNSNILKTRCQNEIITNNNFIDKNNNNYLEEEEAANRDDEYDLQDFPGRGIAREVARLRRRYEEEDEYERRGLEFPLKYPGLPQAFDYHSQIERRYYDDDDDLDEDDDYLVYRNANNNYQRDSDVDIDAEAEGGDQEDDEEEDPIANQSAEMFCQTAMSLDMDNAELMFNLMYFGEGHSGSVGNIINCALEETVALHSENNTPYKLKPAADSIIANLHSAVRQAGDNLSKASETEIQCSVCRGDIEEGETYTKLPRCQHLFHSECIVRWFKMVSSTLFIVLIFVMISNYLKFPFLV